MITPVYLEIALFSGARSGTQATGQVISAIDIADISIHALLAEGDQRGPEVTLPMSGFLSTPSARRATRIVFGSFPPIQNFYPRPPRGGRLANTYSDGGTHVFLSTPSARMATWHILIVVRIMPISIHALREEGDGKCRRELLRPHNFYPRPPRGGRLQPGSSAGGQAQFLSTPSARRATAGCCPSFRQTMISIHALREEGDRLVARQTCVQQDFYPRPPRGGRHQRQHCERVCRRISIHALREEGDSHILPVLVRVFHFYPRPPRGGRPPTAVE